MASPLIVKPMALDNGQYAPIALRLPCEHLDGLILQLRNSGSEARNPGLPQDLPAGTWWPKEAAAQHAQAATIQSLRDYPADDALAAFLNYFAQE